MLDRIALILVIVGAVNWGCIALFGLDLVALCFGGPLSFGQPPDLWSGRPVGPMVHFPAVPAEHQRPPVRKAPLRRGFSCACIRRGKHLY